MEKLRYESIKSKTTTAKLINQMLEYLKLLQCTSNLRGIAQLLTFFTLILFSATKSIEILNWGLSHNQAFKIFFILALIFKPFMLLILGILYFTEPSGDTMRNGARIKTYEFFRNIFVINMKEEEFVIYPFKLFVFLAFFMSQELRGEIMSDGFWGTALYSWTIFDVILTVFACLIKVTFLRSLTPETDFFTKLDGYFEQLIIIFIPIGAFFSATGILNFESPGLRMTYSLIAIICFFIPIFYFFKELPYLNKTAELSMSQLLVNFFGFYLIFCFIGNFKFNESLKIYIMVCLIFVFGAYFLIKKQYDADYLDEKNIGKFKYLKKIYTETHIQKDQKEVIRNYGIIKNHILYGKRDPRYSQIWKLLSQYKKEEDKINILINPKQDSKEFGNLLQKMTTKSEEELFDVKELNYNLIFNKMDGYVFDDYIRENKNSHYSTLLKVIWMLRSDIKLSYMYKTLHMMEYKAQTFREQYYCGYARREISHIFKGIYYQKELYFEKLEMTEIKKSYKIKEDSKKITHQGVDLCYAFEYKDKIQEMVGLVKEYLEVNKAFLDVTEQESKTYQSVNKQMEKMSKLDKKIKLKFHNLHIMAKENHFLHLTPYFYYLYRCANLHKSAREIFKVYKTRIMNKKRFIDEHPSLFNNKNFFENMLIFLIGASKQNFGLILDTYGEANFLNSTHKMLKGEHMNVLIMDCHIDAHDLACDRFNEKTLSKLIGDTSHSYMKIPHTDYIVPVSFNRKIVPFVYSDFDYIIGTKFLPKDSKMYMMVDVNSKIDSFSWNMRYLFENPDEYLVKEFLTLEDLCPKIWERLKICKKMDTVKKEEKSESSSDEGKNSRTSIFMSSNYVKNKEIMSKLGAFFDKDREGTYKTLSNFGSVLFKFRNMKTGKVIRKRFRVEVREKKYKRENFRYWVIVLVQDISHKDWNVKPIRWTKTGMKNQILSKEKEASKEEGNKVKSLGGSDFNSNMSEGVSIGDTKKSPQSSYHFIKDKSLLKLNSDDDVPKYGNNRVEVLLKKELKVGFRTKDDTCSKSVFEMKKNEEDNEEKKENEPISSDSFKEEWIELKSEKSSKRLKKRNPIRNFNSSRNKKFEKSLSLIKERSEDLITELDFSNRPFQIPGGSIFSTATIKSQGKFLLMEEVRANKPLKLSRNLLKFTFFFSSVSLLAFGYYIGYFQKKENLEIYYDDLAMFEIAKFNWSIQNYYSLAMLASAYSSGKISLQRYSGFFFHESIDTSNLEDYLEYKINLNLKTMRKRLTDFHNFLNKEQHLVQDGKLELLFTKNMDIIQILPNKSSITLNNSFYQGYLLTSAENVEVLSKLKISDYSSISENIEFLSFQENVMNGLLESFQKFESELRAISFEKYETFKNFQLNFLIVLIILMAISMIAAIHTVLKVRGYLKKIYENLQKVTKGEIKERKIEIKTLEKILFYFKKENYFGDFMGYRDSPVFKIDHTRSQKHFTDRKYCFRLTFSIISIVVFYLIKVIAAFLIMISLRNNVNTTIWINKKLEIGCKLIYNQAVLMNGIKQSLIFGKESKIFKKNGNEFLENFNTEVHDSSDIVYQLAEEGDDLSYHEETLNILEKISIESICEFNTFLKNNSEYCKLDNGIPAKGLVQSYLRVIQYLNGVYKALKNKDFNFEEVLKNGEFVEFEYTFENVYLPTFLGIGDVFFGVIKDFFLSETERMVNLVWTSILIFLSLAMFFVVKSYLNLVQQIEISIFGYQGFSIHTVLGNTALRLSFLGVFGIGKKKM